MRWSVVRYFSATPLRYNRHNERTFFRLPSVMDAKSFTRFVNLHGRQLVTHLRNEIVENSPHLRSQAFLQKAEQEAQELCLPLTSLTRNEVEHIIVDKYQLTDQRIVTCLVPYQLAANILLSRLPPRIREEAVAELRAGETAEQKSLPPMANKWIQWHDTDIYVSTGVKYLQRISARKQRRAPVFALLGHVNHGKTTLLDALQNSHISHDEPHHITQSIRAFTVPSPRDSQDLFTFVDSPGHRIFVETRFHLHVIADYIVLVISVVDGIESQTHEAIKIALNVDKPIIVVLNKVDLLSDAFSAQQAVKSILSELSTIGLDVELIQKDKRMDAVDKHAKMAQSSSEGKSLLDLQHAQAPYFAPMKSVDPNYQGSRRHPKLNLHRKCYGVCISAINKVRIPLLWRLLHACRDASPPMCYSKTIGPGEHNAAVQATVLESSKHLFDEEGFRLNRSRQHLQRAIDAKKQCRANQFQKKSMRSQLNSFSNSAKIQSTRQNRTSTTCLVITAIVREGVLTEGMHFVADQAEGRVHRLIDYWGNRIEKAYPGMAVTLIDTDSRSGCPWAGISVLSVIDLPTRVRIQAYRQMLQWYIECFTTKLHYLRPRGMDVRFAHLGDYGQLNITDSLEYQLLFGPPSERREADKRLLQLPPGVSDEEVSIGSYLAEKNAGSESNALQVSSAVSVAFPDGETKRLSQGLMDDTTEKVLTATWDGMQRKEPLTSQEEYEQYVLQCVQIGVLIKVDSWHSARMLHREISRLGTRKVYFQVVGSRFGPLQVEDILFFGQAVKVIICFRTPMAASNELDKYIEARDTWVLQTDHFSDIVLFLKWCAVAAHKKRVEDGDDDIEETMTAARPKIMVDAKSLKAGVTDEPKRVERKHKLLIYNGGGSDQDV